MMVETILESSQDFGAGMASVSSGAGALPQWKRELLQRRAARSRPAAPPATAPPPPPAAPPATDDDEELRYGPGIVKRLKSRYLSLALREAPRRRASLLRRATSLEHLLDERPPPAPRPDPARQPRPVSLAVPPTAAPPGPPFAARRDYVKRARSVDALSRLEPREELRPPPSPPPPPPLAPPPAPPLAPRPPVSRAARPPRRPAPLLRDTERPPPDVVRSTLRKFESAPTKRAAPAARVSAVLRGLEPRTSTPEPRARDPSPTPLADLSAVDELEGAALSADIKPVSRAALEGIARAGSTIRYAFDAPRPGSHLPAVAATNPVLLNRIRVSASPRRVGVIRPMPAPGQERPTLTPSPLPDESIDKAAEVFPRPVSPKPVEVEPSAPPRIEKKDSPPSALVEPILRSPVLEVIPTIIESPAPHVPAEEHREPTPEPINVKSVVNNVEEVPKPEPLVNGHIEPERRLEQKIKSVTSRIGAAGIERAWNGASEKKSVSETNEKKPSERVNGVGSAWGRGEVRRGGARGAPPPAATSVVFNFSNRKEVPDYIENDGLILRAARRNKIKAGESGIVVLRPEALTGGSDSEGEGEEERPPSPCAVRFVNDNVLINGRSSMPARPDSRRIAKLKLQFDDSLTRTHEYPSEASLCEDGPPSPSPPPTAAQLLANTHITSESLSRYTPSKTLAEAFQLGVTRLEADPPPKQTQHEAEASNGREETGAETEEDGDDAAAAVSRPWSEARAAATDLLF